MAWGVLRQAQDERVSRGGAEARRGPNLSPTELRVLRALVGLADHGECGFYDEVFFPFKAIVRRTRLKRETVRLACRSLARKGCARYAKGLCNDDGEFRGAGYQATFAGIDLLRAPLIPSPSRGALSVSSARNSSSLRAPLIPSASRGAPPREKNS